MFLRNGFSRQYGIRIIAGDSSKSPWKRLLFSILLICFKFYITLNLTSFTYSITIAAAEYYSIWSASVTSKVFTSNETQQKDTLNAKRLVTLVNNLICKPHAELGINEAIKTKGNGQWFFLHHYTAKNVPRAATSKWFQSFSAVAPQTRMMGPNVIADLHPITSFELRRKWSGINWIKFAFDRRTEILAERNAFNMNMDCDCPFWNWQAPDNAALDRLLVNYRFGCICIQANNG